MANPLCPTIRRAKALNMASPKILLAEDSPTDALYVRTIFEMAGLAITCVANGEQAVGAAAKEAFDLILMNVQMPVMDGHAAIRQIRSAEAQAGKRASRIYAVTSDSAPDDIRASLAAGADRHLAKPLHPGALLAALASVEGGQSST